MYATKLNSMYRVNLKMSFTKTLQVLNAPETHDNTIIAGLNSNIWLFYTYSTTWKCILSALELL